MAYPIPIIHAENGNTSYFRRTPVEDWVNIRTGCGYSVLSVSVKQNHLHCTKVICTRCPDLLYHQSRVARVSPLHLAAYQETKPSLMKFLVSVADRELFRMKDDLGSTPLQLAILKSRIEAVNLLIEADPDQLSWVDRFRGTPVLEALRVSYGKKDDISVKIRRLLLAKKPNACKIRTGKLRWTMLHEASCKGDPGAMEDIIQFCPDSVHMVDNEGHDFVDIASARGHSKIVKNILLRKVLHLAHIMSKIEKELCIPPEYLVLYRELVNRFGEIIEASKCLEDDATPMYAALGCFYVSISEMVHIETRNVTQEKISEWEKMAAEYRRICDWFVKRAEIASKMEALKIFDNELNELNTEVAKLKEQRDTYARKSDDPLYVIRLIEGIKSGNSATQNLNPESLEKHIARSNKVRWQKLYKSYRRRIFFDVGTFVRGQ